MRLEVLGCMLFSQLDMSANLNASILKQCNLDKLGGHAIKELLLLDFLALFAVRIRIRISELLNHVRGKVTWVARRQNVQKDLIKECNQMRH